MKGLAHATAMKPWRSSRVTNSRNTRSMTDPEYARRLDELDRLLNDPAVPMQPAQVWSLLDDLRQRAAGQQIPPLG